MKNISSLIDEAKYLYRSNKIKKAEGLFRKVAKLNDGFADVHNYLGLIAHEEGRYGEAIKSFKSALKTNPRYTEAMLNLSILYNDLGQHENAKKLVLRSRKKAKSSKTVTMDPFIRSKLANKHSEVGDWYHGVGEYAHAVSEYKKALELEPRYVDIRTKMAVCLREKGDKERALNELNKVVKDNSDFVQAYIQLGVTFYSMNQKTEARKIWRAAAKKFPQVQSIKMYLRFSGSK